MLDDVDIAIILGQFDVLVEYISISLTLFIMNNYAIVLQYKQNMQCSDDELLNIIATRSLTVQMTMTMTPLQSNK